jgi:Glycine-rich domain-containing protein-like
VDIAWLWHCHRLAPSRYESFCLRRFGTILEPLPAFVFQTASRCPDARTAELWALKYPQEPLFAWTVLENGADATDSPSKNDLDRLVDGFNILASASAQSGFLWHVSGPRYQEDDFLLDAVENYHKFLALSPGDLPLVPTFQIDLMWHTHMLASVTKYNSDCWSVRGSTFNHDDSLNDRTPGGTLDLAFQDTCRRWELAYGKAYAVAGGMYQGEPDAAYYDNTTWTPAALPNATKDVMVPLATTTATGATSTGLDSSSQWILPSQANRTFIKANNKASVGQPNSNPFRDGYVFGKGSMGDGYYSLQTKDAFKILEWRLAQKYKLEHSLYHGYECQHCLCLGCKLSETHLQEKDRYKVKLDETGELLAIIKTLLTMPGPDAKITLEAAKRNGAMGNNDKLTSVTPAGDAYYGAAPATLLAAGGCGGGVSYGGGCGGGAACGAGCSGGGGGGCGGGGCGGGCGGGGGG